MLTDRYQRRSTVLTSQLPVAKSHAQIGDPTIADSILDRLAHNTHRIELKGESLRKKRARKAAEEETNLRSHSSVPRASSPPSARSATVRLRCAETAPCRATRAAGASRRSVRGRRSGLLRREDGSIWPPSAFTSAYRALLRRRNVRNVNFHALRHAHASQLLTAGISPEVISERLGAPRSA